MLIPFINLPVVELFAVGKREKGKKIWKILVDIKKTMIVMSGGHSVRIYSKVAYFPVVHESSCDVECFSV